MVIGGCGSVSGVIFTTLLGIDSSLVGITKSSGSCWITFKPTISAMISSTPRRISLRIWCASHFSLKVLRNIIPHYHTLVFTLAFEYYIIDCLK